MLRVFHPTDKWPSFFKKETRDFFLQYFNHYQLETDAVPTDKNTDVLLIPNYYYQPTFNQFKPYLDKGFKCIFDNVWEDRMCIKPADQFFPEIYRDYEENIFTFLSAKSKLENNVVQVLSWFWIHEFLWLKHNNVQYTPNIINDKLFLLPMMKTKPIRRKIWELTKKWHEESFVSLVGEGHTLEADGMEHNIESQRIVDPDWYDRTLFSVVVESYPEDDIHSTLFTTEKTYKPLAHQHPFIVLNKPHSLKWLKDQGFATYDNIFDESYDDVEDLDDRLEKVLDNVHRFEYDDETLKRIKHNHSHFWDMAEIVKRTETEIISPIWEFIS